MVLFRLKPHVVIKILSGGFHGDKIIELGVVMKSTGVVAFTIAIFEAHELNVSWGRLLGGFYFLAFLFQFRFLVENVVVNDLELKPPDNVCRVFNAAGFLKALVVNGGEIVLAVEGADQNDD